MTDWNVKRAATCYADGIEEKYCRTCTTQNSERALAKRTHNWSEWKIDKPADCEKAGVEKRVCLHSGCDGVDTKAIPQLEHKFSEWKVSQNADCEKEEKESRTCSLCDLVQTRTTKPAWGHKYGSWGDKVDSTCTKEGSEKRTCSVCKKYETHAIPKLPHKSDGVWEVEREATLSKPGLEITHCKDCGAQASSRNFTPRGYRYEVPTSAWGPMAGEYPGGGSSPLRLLYLDLTYDSDQRFALVTEDGWLIGFAHVTVANGAVRVSVEKKSEATVMRYRAWGMFPDAATTKAVNYDNSLPFDQAVKGPGESCVIALNMISNYYQGTGNERFSDGLLSYDGEASYAQINELMLQMAEGSGE
jgi:hypothetical protein